MTYRMHFTVVADLPDEVLPTCAAVWMHQHLSKLAVLPESHVHLIESVRMLPPHANLCPHCSERPIQKYPEASCFQCLFEEKLEEEVRDFFKWTAKATAGDTVRREERRASMLLALNALYDDTLRNEIARRLDVPLSEVSSAIWDRATQF